MATGEERITYSAMARLPNRQFTGKGAVRSSVWKTELEEGRIEYSVSIDRLFRDESDELMATPMLRSTDLEAAQKLIGQAEAWINEDKKGLKNLRIQSI
jgi:hypothetical protein